MSQHLTLPLLPPYRHEGYPKADAVCANRVLAFINQRASHIRETCSRQTATRQVCLTAQPSELADKIADLLTHRVFNFQSRGRVRPLLPRVRHKLLQQVSSGSPITLFLLYNGGYRASPFPDQPSLIFEPDQTELLLLYQIASLNQKVKALYPPGIDFSIVVNNGVALWVNDIPLHHTENYARQLRRMIAALDADRTISVLLQSELAGYEPQRVLGLVCPQLPFSDKEHRVVERFLGRRCSREEAHYRTALYALAEAQWAQDLNPIVAKKQALILRQVAHPEMLSFRPYPGGAIRIQNGSLGFQEKANALVPKLITTANVQQCGVKWFPCTFRWSARDQKLQAVVPSNA